MEYIRRFYKNSYSYRTVLPIEIATQWWAEGVRHLKIRYDKKQNCLVVEPLLFDADE